eukprot:m.295721 g.295721  ORF g.295721 m.295721 type:complete len:137 (+) comp40760_c1_seq16:550-960(+)
MADHRLSLSRFCRVCGALFSVRGGKQFKCIDYADLFQLGIKIAVADDSPDVLAPAFCTNCRATLFRAREADQRNCTCSYCSCSLTKVVDWPVHRENDCFSCSSSYAKSKVEGGRQLREDEQLAGLTMKVNKPFTIT